MREGGLAAPSVGRENEIIRPKRNIIIFRPLAPAVLAEEAHEWFEGGCRASPFMSRVWVLKEEASLRVPACAHVDRTARPQTVGENEIDIMKMVTEKGYVDVEWIAEGKPPFDD